MRQYASKSQATFILFQHAVAVEEKILLRVYELRNKLAKFLHEKRPEWA